MSTFQNRVAPWMQECFGAEISSDTVERNHRFIEEALELVQACGCSRADAIRLVDYVYGRPVGVPEQEVGGVMVTLAALCLAQGMDMHRAGDIELERIWTNVEAIRAKQASKPKGSPLPMKVTSTINQNEALFQASEWFADYAAHHERKGDMVKAARNRERSVFCAQMGGSVKAEKRENFTFQSLKALFKAAGGTQHGPNIEHYSIEESRWRTFVELVNHEIGADA